MEDKNKDETTPNKSNENAPLINNQGLDESNAAKRIRLTEDNSQSQNSGEYDSNTPVTLGGRISNFWYHNKTKVIITAFFAIAIGIAIGQFLSQSNPDVYILYCGPEYITARDNQVFCSAIKDIMKTDFNGDGEKKVRLTDIIYMTQSQVDKAQAAAEANGDDFAFDIMSNQKMSEKFSYEVFGSDSIICILAEEQYTQVMRSEGFLPLSEIFGDVEIQGAIDSYGIRFKDTKFYEFYDSTHIFPDDAVLAIRRVSTMSALTGREKAEKVHAYHVELFKSIVNFEFPEGYVPNHEQ